jgi:hypothetical protein
MKTLLSCFACLIALSAQADSLSYPRLSAGSEYENLNGRPAANVILDEHLLSTMMEDGAAATILPFSVTVNVDDRGTVDLKSLKAAIFEAVGSENAYMQARIRAIEFVTIRETIGDTNYRSYTVSLAEADVSLRYQTAGKQVLATIDGMIAMSGARNDVSNGVKTDMFVGFGFPVGYKASIQFFNILEVNQFGSYESMTIGEGGADDWENMFQLGELGVGLEISLKGMFRKIQKFPNIKIYARASKVSLNTHYYYSEVTNSPLPIDDRAGGRTMRLKAGFSWDF